MISGLTSWIINGQCNHTNPESLYRPSWSEKLLQMILLPPPENHHQRGVNNSWSCILHNLRAMEWHWPTIHLLAAFMGKTASDDVTSAYYNCAPMQHEQFRWRLSKLHSTAMHCVVPRLSFLRSVFSICPCIQLHKSACHALQIWLCFCL